MSHYLRFIIAAILCAGAITAGNSVVAQEEPSCSERMPEVKALVDQMSDQADKAVAEKQFEKAQELFASGRERNCILYLEALRANIVSGDFSDG